ncbi:hypothetical protein [Streptomyces cinereoruber]|uniref:hypothetical protein n=1 Tax=Streptomyces cinereoruber TaxID=67260 RepID=UPI00364A2DF4
MHLSKIEVKVSRAFASGRSAVEELDRKTLFLWIGKIYYGLMFRELFLRSSQRDPESPSIMDADYLALFSSHHLLLQAARGVVDWREGESPASFLFFDCQESSNNARLNFDYLDIVNLPFLAIRVGSVGVVACLQDWGRLSGHHTDPVLEMARSMVLHPQQFREVAARAAYAIKRGGDIPGYIPIYGPEVVWVMNPEFLAEPEENVVAPADEELYAGLLGMALLQSPEELHCDGVTLSLLHDKKGRPLRLPWSVDEWKRVSM